MKCIYVITARRVFVGLLLLAVFGFSTASFAGVSRVQALPLASVYAAIAPLGSSELIYSQHSDRIVPIASLTKLMTALVILESGMPLDESLEVSRISNTFGKNSPSRLRPGTRVSRQDLMQMSLMSSENLATYTLAANYPGGTAAFVSAMNATAALLGMSNTHFTDPTGLSPDNRSTAQDLLILSSAVYQYPLIRQFSTRGQIDMHFRSPSYSLAYTNTNPLTRNANWKVMLSKTGYLSESGRCLIMVADIDGELVTMVLLDSQGLRTPIGDVGRINRWLRNQPPGEVPANAVAYAQSRLAAMH